MWMRKNCAWLTSIWHLKTDSSSNILGQTGSSRAIFPNDEQETFLAALDFYIIIASKWLSTIYMYYDISIINTKNSVLFLHWSAEKCISQILTFQYKIRKEDCCQSLVGIACLCKHTAINQTTPTQSSWRSFIKHRINNTYDVYISEHCETLLLYISRDYLMINWSTKK